MKHFDTYSPMDLDKFLNKLKLEGLSIIKIESPSFVYEAVEKKFLDTDTQKYEISHKEAEIDAETIISFSNGKKISFDFYAASHVFINQYNSDYEMTDIQYNDGEATISDIFANVVGKTIKKYEVHSTKNVNEIGGWEDGGFDENQDAFITRFDLVFTDGSRICFENYIDFTVLLYVAY